MNAQLIAGTLTANMLVPAHYLRWAPAIAPDVVGEISGYLAVWGSPDQVDAYGTWFDRSKPPNLGLQGGHFLPVRLMYEHGMGELGRAIVGAVTEVWYDQVGIAFRGSLDAASPFFDDIVEQISHHELAISSAAAEHLAAFDDQGRFVEWYLSEVSLTAYPAEPRMRKVTLLRSAPAEGSEARGRVSGRGGQAAGSGASYSSAKPTEIRTMSTRALSLEQLGLNPASTLEDFMAALVETLGAEAAQAWVMAQMGGGAAPEPTAEDVPEGEVLSAPPEPRNDPPAPTQAAEMIRQLMARAMPASGSSRQELQDVRNQLAAMRRQMQTAPAPAEPEQVRNRSGATPNIQVSEPRRYAHLDAQDLMLGHMIMRSKHIAPSDDFQRVLAGRVVRTVERDQKHFLNDPVVRSFMPNPGGTLRSAEVMISTATGGGDEWVGVGYVTQLWEKARSNRIYQQIFGKGIWEVEVAQGEESVTIPLEGADPTVYTVAQNADLSSNRPAANVAVTRVGTSSTTLTPKEVGMAVVYSDVFEEDSLIPVLPQLNRQLSEKAEETIEQAIINGDTETGASTNINLIDGTPGTGLSAPYYLSMNGFLKYALVTGTSTSRDGGALDASDYRLTWKLMPYAIRTRRQNLLFIIDPDTHAISIDILEVKTEDVRGSAATINSGVLERIWGIDVAESGFMPLANSAGKVPTAGGTLGRILLVYAPFWAFAWKRRMRIETDRDIISGDNIIVAKMRMGMVPRGAGSSVCSYNITV